MLRIRLRTAFSPLYYTRFISPIQSASRSLEWSEIGREEPAVSTQRLDGLTLLGDGNEQVIGIPEKGKNRQTSIDPCCREFECTHHVASVNIGMPAVLSGVIRLHKMPVRAVKRRWSRRV
jgi:hypothetical protein